MNKSNYNRIKTEIYSEALADINDNINTTSGNFSWAHKALRNYRSKRHVIYRVNCCRKHFKCRILSRKKLYTCYNPHKQTYTHQYTYLLTAPAAVHRRFLFIEIIRNMNCLPGIIDATGEYFFLYHQHKFSSLGCHVSQSLISS